MKGEARKSRQLRLLEAALDKTLAKLHIEAGDIVLVKSEETYNAIADLMQLGYPKPVAFVFAPEGLEKVSRADLEGVLRDLPDQRVLLAP